MLGHQISHCTVSLPFLPARHPVRLPCICMLPFQEQFNIMELNELLFQVPALLWRDAVPVRLRLLLMTLWFSRVQRRK